MPTETKVWKAVGGGGGGSKSEDTTTINIESLQLKIVNIGNDDNDSSDSEDSDDELGALIYNSSNTARKCREEANKKDTVSIATTQGAEVGGRERRTHDVSTFDDTMTSDVMDSRLSDNISIATNKLQQNYISNNTDTVSTHHVEQKKKQRYANKEIVKRLLAERELKRMYDMKNNKQQLRGSSSVEEAVGMDMKSRDGHISGDNKGDTNKNVNEKKKDTDAANQSPPLVDPQEETEKNSSTSISEYVTAMNSIESMLSNRMKKEKERRMVASKSQEQSKKEDVPKSVSLPSTPPRDFDWVSYYRQQKDKNANKTTSSFTADKAKKQKKAAKEPPVVVTKRNYQKSYHNYQIKDVKALKQISTVVIPQPRPTRPHQPQVNGRDWKSQRHLLHHHTPTHRRQRTPYSQRYHPPTLHKASPPPYQSPTRVHKKHKPTPKYKTKRPPGRPKHGVSERKMLRGPPPVVHNGSPWGSKIDSRGEDVVVDTRDDIEEDSRAGPSGLVMDQRKKEVRDIKKGRRVGALAKAKAQALAKERKRHEEVIYVYDADGRRITGQVAKAKAQVLAKQRNQREVDHETEELKQTLTMDREGKINLERKKEDESYSMEAERLVKRAKHCEKGNEEQVRRVKELLEMSDDIKHLGEEREREEGQIRYVQMLAVRELQRRQVIGSRTNWM